jgi:Flp pilus assembly protein TadG
MDDRLQFGRFLKVRFQRGVATIEFSLLIVPLLLMLFGVTEYGRAIYQYNTLVKSVRDATRYLSTLDAGDLPETVNGNTTYYNAACLAVYGNFACSGKPLVPGLKTTMVSIKDRTNSTDHAAEVTGSGTINLVTVTISGYQFRSLINFPLGDITVGAPNITYHPIHNTMRQI